MLLCLVVAMMFSSCDDRRKTTSTTGFCKIMCDESFRNILDQEVEVFEYTYPESHVMARFQSETDALDSLLRKKCDLIISSRDLTDKQREILKLQGRAYRSRMIAVDAVAVIVNKENDIDELSMEDLEEIMQGKVKRWGDVFPTSLKNDSIKIVFDKNGSGIMHYMLDNFTKDGKLPDNVFAKQSSDELFKTIQQHKNAIGFLGVSWITASMDAPELTIEQRVTDLKENNNDVTAISFTDRIKVMKIRGRDQISGCKPYQVYINDGSYPLFRKVYAIDASPSGSLEHGFYSFLTGVIGQKIILQTGIMPAGESLRVVEIVN